MRDYPSRQPKSSVTRARLIPILILIVILAACTSGQPTQPTPTNEEEAHAASVATISAQLTGIAQPKPIGATGSPAASENPSPTETFPPTSTPRPTRTPLPSDTPEPSPTIPESSPTGEAANSPTFSIGNPKAGLGEPTWVDAFAGDTINWPLYNDEHVNMQITEDGLVITALTANRKDPWDAWMVNQMDLGDFYLEVTATPGECQGLDRYGLLARAALDASQAYVFGFSCDGRYSLRLWNGQKFYLLKEWTASQFVHKGAGNENRLGLLARGEQIAIYANDTQLAEIENDAFSEGAIGLFVGAAMTDNFRVSFKQVAYWDLP